LIKIELDVWHPVHNETLQKFQLKKASRPTPVKIGDIITNPEKFVVC